MIAESWASVRRAASAFPPFALGEHFDDLVAVDGDNIGQQMDIARVRVAIANNKLDLSHHESLACRLAISQKLANLFKSRADMEQWIAWLNKPEKPTGHSGKVVHLKKPH